jgi:hypothetical protein
MSTGGSPNLQGYDQLQGLAKQQQTSSQVGQVGPGGSSLWSTDANGRPVQTSSLSGANQNIYNNAQNGISTPFSLSGLPAAPDAEATRNQAINASYGQATSRLDPKFAQSDEALHSQLLNQGLRPGDAAYDKAMAGAARNKTDAYNTAMNSAIGSGAQAAQQMFGMGQQQHQTGIQDYELGRTGGINEMGAFGQAESALAPKFGPNQQAPDLLGAANMANQNQIDIYNTNAAKQNSLMSGMFGLGGKLLSPFAQAGATAAFA